MELTVQNLPKSVAEEMRSQLDQTQHTSGLTSDQQVDVSVRERNIVLTLSCRKPTYKRIPPKPARLIGREKEEEAIIKILLNPNSESRSPRLAITGGGGLGKTSLALSVLHNPGIVQHFQNRWFINCEASTSVEQLLIEFADVLEIPPYQRDRDILETIIKIVSDLPSILCLDNFETPWLEGDQEKIEAFLLHFTDIKTLAVITTTRVTELPPSVEWSDWTQSESLRPLSSSETWEIIDSIAHRRKLSREQTHVQKLLDLVEGMPLSATLLGYLLNGSESPKQLLTQWESSGTAMMSRRTAPSRLTSVDASIHLSLTCRYMRDCPDAAELLALFALLPDGFPNSDDREEELRQFLPPPFQFFAALRTLNHVSLVFINQTTAPSRIQLLPPVRLYCQSYLTESLSSDLVNRMTQFYIMLLDNYCRSDGASHHVILPELRNLEAILSLALTRGTEHLTDEAVFKAAITYTRWSIHVGCPSTSVIVRATAHSGTDFPSLPIQANCLAEEGYILQILDDLVNAQTCLERAVDLHREVRDTLGEANDLQYLGHIHLRRDNLKAAELSLHRAVELHRQINNVSGEGYDLQYLGELQLRVNKLDKAEAAFQRAVHLQQQANDILGEASVLRFLGKLQMRQYKLDDAEASFRRALELHCQTHNVVGQANNLQYLGAIQMRRNRFEDAEVFLRDAIRLHSQANSIFGEAHDQRNLGELQMRRNQLDNAEVSFRRAIKLHHQAHSIVGEAHDIQDLGLLQLERHELDNAEASFQQAIRLHHKANNIAGEGYDLLYLGRLEIQRGNLHNAEDHLLLAIKYHQQAHDVLGEANDLHFLGQVCLSQKSFDEAQVHFEQALILHTEVDDSWGKENDSLYLVMVENMRKEYSGMHY